MRRGFPDWHPLSYAEHFTASNFKARDLAISSYEFADPNMQSNSRDITSSMTAILSAVSDAMRKATQDKTRAILAEQATGWVKPLVMLTAGIINGDREADVDYIMTTSPWFSRFSRRIPSWPSRRRSFATARSCWCGGPNRRPGACIRCPAAGLNSAKRCTPPCIARSMRKPR